MANYIRLRKNAICFKFLKPPTSNHRAIDIDIDIYIDIEPTLTSMDRVDQSFLHRTTIFRTNKDSTVSTPNKPRFFIFPTEEMAFAVISNDSLACFSMETFNSTRLEKNIDAHRGGGG